MPSVCTGELNVDNWNDNCEAKSEAKRPRPLRGFQVDFNSHVMFLTRSDNNIICEGLLAVNESETLNRSFTIILAVHQPYSIINVVCCVGIVEI